MDSAELALWEAEYAIQPWGPEREDYRAGVAAHAAEAAWHGDKARSPADFFPGTLKPEPEPQTAEEQVDAARRFNSLFGGEVR